MLAQLPRLASGYPCAMSFPGPFYRWRPHPWHGLDVGPQPPNLVNGYVELTPFDLVKYEIDKVTGYLRVDRPQRTSSQPPALYGFIPRTYCGERVCALMDGASRGDGDPLDLLILSERPINRSEVILTARVVGGLPMNDDGEADDKIITVLDNDPFYQGTTDIADVPAVLIERLRHYFTTYKMDSAEVSIADAYGRDHAHKVINASIEDYKTTFGE